MSIREAFREFLFDHVRAVRDLANNLISDEAFRVMAVATGYPPELVEEARTLMPHELRNDPEVVYGLLRASRASGVSPVERAKRDFAGLAATVQTLAGPNTVSVTSARMHATRPLCSDPTCANCRKRRSNLPS